MTQLTVTDKLRIMTLRSSDLQPDGDLDSIRNSCDVLSNIPIQLFCSNLELCLRYFALILIIGRGWPGPARCLKNWRSRWAACSIDEQLKNQLMFDRTIGSDFWKAKSMLTRTWRDGQKSIIITPPDNKLTRERALVNYQTMSRTSIWQIAGSTNDTVEVQLYIKS